MRNGTVSLLVAAGLFFLPALGALGDKPVAENEIPKVVMDAVRIAIPKAEFLRGEVEDHHQPAVYELDVRVGEEVSHLHVTADGKVTRMVKGFMREGNFPPDKLPAATLDALKKLRPDPKILEVEMGHYRQNIILYEIRVKCDAGGEEEFFITREGEVVKVEDHRHKRN